MAADRSKPKSNLEPIKPWQCGARLKSKPGRGVAYCRRAKAKGRERCPLHGGVNPQGADCSWFLHGARSKFLPVGWIENYERYLAEKDITLEREVAIARVLMDEALLNVKEGTPWGITREVRKRILELKTALSMKDTEPAEIIRLVSSLDNLTAGAVAAERSRKELREAVDFSSKIAKREADRQIAMGAVLTPIQAAMIFRAFEEAIKRYVSDRDTIANIANHLAPAIGGRVVRKPAVDSPGSTGGEGTGGNGAGVSAPEPA